MGMLMGRGAHGCSLQHSVHTLSTLLTASARHYRPSTLTRRPTRESRLCAKRLSDGKSPASKSTEPFLDEFGKKNLFVVSIGLLGFLALIHVVGFYGAIFVFLIYYIRFVGRHPWLTTLSISVAIPTIGFFFFDVAMRIVLPKGYSEPLFIPLYDLFL